MKVLVVDDTGTNRSVIAALLAKTGYEALSAGTVDEALRLLLDQRPDAVLTDLNMPDAAAGLAFARRIRELPFGREIRLALMTADATPAVNDKDLFDGVLEKPVLARDIVNFLEGSK